MLHHVAIGVAAAGPGLAGVLFTARAEGRSGVRRLFNSLLRWRLGRRWYILSVGGPIAVALAAVAAHRVIVGDARDVRGSRGLASTPSNFVASSRAQFVDH